MWIVKHSSGVSACVRSLAGYELPDWRLIGEKPGSVPAEFAMVDALDQIVADLDRARAQKWAAIKARRAELLAGSVTTAIGQLQIDVESRSNLRSALAVAKANETQAKVRLLGNALELVPPLSLETAIGEIDAFVVAAHEHSWALEAQVLEADSISAIQAIDIDSGWPA